MTDQLSPSVATAIPVCGIGASAGAVEALQQFFRALPVDLGLAYVVIVHLLPDHKSELPSILRRWTSMPVVQVSDHDNIPIRGNHVYVIAPDRKLEITADAIGAASFDEPHGQRTAIDVFFRSLAETHGDGFAVLLSGSGSDGAIGAKAVRARGGLVLVQDPSEATHSGIPRAAIAAGAADLVLPIRELAARLAELARTKQLFVPTARQPEAMTVVPADEENALKSVLDLLRKRTGHDFSKYKRSTTLRRLSRRMHLAHQVTIAEYLKYLRAHVTETQALFDDLLISVTTFFRDPEAWAVLQAQVVSPLVERSDADEQLRVWVPGCATGEEAYSVAMLFHEEFERRNHAANYIVFASDLDESALAVGREGLYSQAIAADLTEARLERYFRPDDDHYRVISHLRDHLVFAAHDLLRDPPFSQLHLVTCRNLLIYLDRDLQAQAMSVFRYACRDDGALFLGASESADEDLFHPIAKRHRIFGIRQRDDSTRPPLPDGVSITVGPGRAAYATRSVPKSTAAEIHAAALEQVAPPTVVIDERWNVLHVSPSASRFFQQSGGALARRVTDLVRPELRDELHVLLQRAFESLAPQLGPFVAVTFNGSDHKVAVLAQQRATVREGRRDVLITFLDAGAVTSEAPVSDAEPDSDLVRALRKTVHQAERRIEGMRDDHHLTTEDLRAANEELQSLNEEYRATTEELETSKEELQSLNEELHTVNQELKVKLEEVSRAHSDLENLMSATNVATLFLTPDLHIKRFTPQLAEIFNVKARDVERPITDLSHTLDYDVEADARRVLASGTPIEREAKSQSGQSFVVRIGPYRTAGADIDGIVATFVDVTALKQAEAALRGSEMQLESELNVMRRLHAMTLRVATAPTMKAGLEHVLAAAIELHGADFGNVQLADRESKQLRLEVQRGFTSPVMGRVQQVGADDNSASGRALRRGQVVQIEDVTRDPDSQPYRADAAQAGYRAVQSVPLIGREGSVVGVLSVHFKDVHTFSERDKQFGDMLAHQAADLIESLAQHESVRQLNETLRHRTQKLEASQEQLAEQAEDLRQQDRNREQFLAALGHELRNPLAAIHSAIQLMTPADDRSQWALAVLQRQTQHMTRLINDLLDVTRVRHGRISLQRRPTDVAAVVHAEIEAVRARAEAKGLRVVANLPSDPLYVDADPERLAQVLDNLLRNSVAYTHQGEVAISLRQEGGAAHVAVRDTGIGVAAADAHQLFQPYQRGPGHHGEGLGLGLTLVKALVEAHGGALTWESEGVGRGSEFRFTMPIASQAPTTDHAGVLPRAVSRRVLIVDDERDVADMFGGLLEKLGQEVRVAYDAETALRVAREHRPEVAFLDVAMPGTNGGQLADRLRAQLGPATPVIVAVTGHDRRAEAIQSGRFDQHLLKPPSVESLVPLLNELPRGRVQ